jgi:hypothetical protein
MSFRFTRRAVAAAVAVVVGAVAGPLLAAPTPAGASSSTVETYDAYANGGAGEVVASSVSSFTLDNITYTTDAATESGVYTSSTNNGTVDDAPLSTGPTDGVLMINDTGNDPVTEVTITLADGDPMSVSSFDFDEGLSNGTIYVIPDGNAANKVTLSGSQLSGLVNLSGNANFKSDTSIEILDSGDSGNFTPTLNNFTYTDLSSPPVLTSSGGTTSFVEGDDVAQTPSTPVPVDPGMTLTDGDSTTATAATVSITTNLQSNLDMLSFTNTSSATYGNIFGTYDAGTGTLSLSSSGGTATIAQWQAALDAVTYTDTAATPNPATRTVSFEVTSDGFTASNIVTKQVSVTTTDQIPVVRTTGGTTSYEAGAPAVTIDSGVTVTDPDTATQASATVSLSTGFHSGDTLSFTNGSATLYGNIAVASYNSATGVLTLVSAGASATDAQWTNALEAVTFSSTSTSYGNRTVSFVANDGTDNSTPATKTVDLTAGPTITTDSGSAAFVAGDNTLSTPVAVDSGVTVSDGSTATLVSTTVSITGGLRSGEDVLSFTNNGATMGNIAGSYNASTGVLTLTSSSDSASIAQWQAALEAVTYTDTAITPNNATRTVSFSTTDFNAVTSATATRNVTVVDTDQTPIVTATGGTTLNYAGGDTPQTVDGGITVSDRDNTTQASARVSITTGFHSGDTLGFSNTSATLYGNISVQSYDSATGVLTLSSAGATATDAQWANALSAVTFSSTSSTFSSRTVSFVVNDGTENSPAATDTVNLSDPVAVTTDSGSAAFVAGDNTASTPVTVDAGLTVADAGTSTMTSATVSVSTNFQAGEDVLLFTNDGSTMGNITGSYNAPTGVLTLTSSGNSATRAQWQNALEAVTYTDTAVTPNNATRTISFSVTDANAYTSNTATRNVTVADTDQTPIITATGGTTLNYVAGASAATIDSSVTVSDLDNTTQSSGMVAITIGFHSGDTLSFTNTSATLYGNITGSYDAGTAVLTLTSAGSTATDAQWANAFSAVEFSAGAVAPGGNRTVSFSLNDGTESSVAATDTVSVSAPPHLTPDLGPATFVAGDNTTSTPVPVDPGLLVTDGSASTLASATASVTSNFQGGEDVLGFTNDGATTGNIIGFYDTSSGVLTLASAGATATLTQWQNALDAVTYTDTAVTPDNATRTVSFNALDTSFNNSNTATRNVTVSDTDQTPIVTATSGTDTYTTAAPEPAQAVDGGITVSDLDNPTLASATVTITSDFVSGEDVLVFVNDGSTMGNIAGTYDASTGVLALSSAGATATLAQWQAALGAVTFQDLGQPPTPGPRTVSFAVNDGTENSAAATKTLDVSYTALAVSTAELPSATSGTSYSSTIAATGGLGATSWSVTSGSLPVGLTLDSASGVLQGTPTTSGNYSFAVEVTDANGDTASQSLTLQVAAAPVAPSHAHGGYWLAGSDGGVFAFGDARYLGSMSGQHLNAPIVGMAPTPDAKGYWLVASDGGVFAFGDAGFYGSAGSLHLNKPIVAIAATSDGLGYWLVASDGGVFAYGDASFYGSTGALHLNSPIASIATTAGGDGYWLVASDGGVFSFGDAPFDGSLAGQHLSAPITAMAPTSDGSGYWLVGADGSVANFGDARSQGSLTGQHLDAPIVGIDPTSAGNGYWLVASDGGVFTCGDAPFAGSLGGQPLSAPIVGTSAPHSAT